MSIIADTLTRLQAERPRRPDHSVLPDFSSPLIPSRDLGNRLPVLVGVLGCLGIAVYLWGLPFLAAPDTVMPKQDKVKAVQSAKPAKPVSSGIVESMPEQREDLPVATTTDKREDSDSTGPALVPDPPPASPDAGNAPIRKPVSSPGIQFTAKPPPMPHSHSASSVQRKNRVFPRLRNATLSEIKLVRAQSFIKQRQYAQAINILEPLFANPPERWEPWFWLGTAQLGAGQLEKARASLVDGLARDATVPQLWVQRALVSQQQRRFGEALDALRQAELLAPELPEVQLNLAYTLEMTGDRLLAGQHYRMFLTLTEGKKAYHATRKKVLDRISRLRKT
ncbi:MAG: tetratricopeptide repeat protein [Nitrospira sp. SB0677_bin_15]|nr:tetratricopeptide repeat protein [Nitrospira sp. SB0677_bin_15]